MLLRHSLKALIAIALLVSKWGGFLAFAAILMLIAVADWKLAKTCLADSENGA